MTESPARARARRLYPASKAFQGAYIKGARASTAGLPRTANPYKLDAGKSWRVAYRRAWHRGFDSEEQEE